MSGSDRPTFLDAARALGAEGLGLLGPILEDAPFGVYIDDPTHGCTYANPALLAQFGVDWDAFRGFGWARHIVPEDAERLQSAIAEYEHARAEINVTYRVQAGRWVHARVRAVVDGASAHVGSIGVTQDVTDERVFRRHAKRSQNLEAVGQLAARLAHDLNNLLTVIIGNAEMLALGADEGRANQFFAPLELAFEQSRQLTQQLLVLSSGRVRSKATSRLDVELERIARLLRSSAGEAVEIDLRLDAGGCWVPLDPTSLGQIMINLVTNARDAMDGRGRLRVATTCDDKSATILVEDEGCGMDDDTAARAFQPFFTTKEEGRGSGLGLTTLQDIAQLAGGEVALASEPGRGTRATVTLPRVGPNLYQAAGRAPDLDAAPDGLTILVLEDNDALRQSLGYALAMAGHTVPAAGFLSEARERLAAAGPIDVMISDVLLPDGHGPELVAEVRRDHPDLKVVYTSGFAGPGAKTLEADDPHAVFIPKPFRNGDILQAVAAFARA